MATVENDPWFRLGQSACACESEPVTAAVAPLRRNPTDTELRAGTDFEKMDKDWTDAVDGAVSSVASIRKKQIASLVKQVQKAASSGLDALDSITIDPAPLEAALIPHLTRAAQAAAEEQQREAESQGVTVPDWTLSASSRVYHGPTYSALTAAVGADLLRSVARVTSRLMSTALVQSAIRKALSLVGRSALTPVQVADEVRDHLNGLTEAGPREAVAGAVTAAQNEGRRTVLAVAPKATYTSSEILDANVCGPCREEDGKTYGTLNEALRAYPAGGFRECLGGPRCRGTYIATWGE